MRTVLLLVIDTLRHPRYFPGGDFSSSCPHLHDLSRHGVEFEGLVSASSWTLHAHYTLLTQRQPWDIGYEVSTGRYTPPQTEGCGAVARANGFSTAAFSANPILNNKRGLLSPHFDQGTHTSLLHADATLARLVDTSGFERWVNRFALLPPARQQRYHNDDSARLPRELAGLGLSFATRSATSRSLLHRLNRHLARDAHRDQPRFLFVNLMDLHEPYARGSLPVGERGSAVVFPTRNIYVHTPLLSEAPDLGALLQRHYLQTAIRMDHSLGELLSLLKLKGFLDDCDMMLVSDHGQSLGEDRIYGHGHYLTDSLLNVPGVVARFRGGNQVNEGETIKGLAGLRDMGALLSQMLSGRLESGDVARWCQQRSLPAAGSVAYWEGGLMDRNARFPFVAHVPGTVRRTLRAFVEGGSACIEAVARDSEPSPPRVVSSGEKANTASELAWEYWEKIAKASGSRASAGNEPSGEVENRLTSWGYS